MLKKYFHRERFEMSAANLQIEWNRLELLAEFVGNNRAGKATNESRRQELAVLQTQVNQLRGEKPWRDVVDTCGLSRLDQDILGLHLGARVKSTTWMDVPGITTRLGFKLSKSGIDTRIVIY